MLSIYTLNQRNALCDHARASHEAAAQRWNATYTVLSEWPGRRKDTFGGKLELHLLPGDRCIWLDADTLIRSDCPSLFDLTPAGSLGAVVCDQGIATPDVREMTSRVCEHVSRHLGIYYDYDPSRYFNGGVLVWSSCHRDIWRFLDDKMPTHATGPMAEQTAQNVAARASWHDVELLDWTYNRVGPVTWELDGEMVSYIHHWANWGPCRGEKRERMSRVRWRV